MADRGSRGLAVAVVAAAVFALPASASAGLTPWLVGATYDGPAPAATVVDAPSASVVIRHHGRVGRELACDGTVTLTLEHGARVLQRRTARLDRRCRFRTTFRVRRSALGGATRLSVVRRFRGRTASAQVRVPAEGSERVGSRGLDEGLQAPEALDLS